MNCNDNIPKIIHYCWFGKNEKPDIVKKCIDSWKKILNEYEIIEWNEKNFKIDSNKFVKQAYDSKKFAFVSDYVRVYALYNYGGIYLDTDVELLRPLDELLKDKMFCGWESRDQILDKNINNGTWLSILNSKKDVILIIKAYYIHHFI